jgi:cell division protein FtsQ
MRINRSVRYGLIYTATALLTVGLISLAEYKQANMEVTEVSIELLDAAEWNFLDIQDIESLVTSGGNEPLVGMPLRALKLQPLENKIEANPFTDEVAAFVDQKGRVSVRVKQKHPLARFSDGRGNDVYVNTSGELLPLSEKFTPRLPILHGSRVMEVLKGEDLERKAQLLKLLSLMREDDFLSAQVTALEWTSTGIVLYTRIGDQLIEIGDPVDLESKMEKMLIFYKRIAPAQGWNRYSRVNVTYENQIICE